MLDAPLGVVSDGSSFDLTRSRSVAPRGDTSRVLFAPRAPFREIVGLDETTGEILFTIP